MDETTATSEMRVVTLNLWGRRGEWNERRRVLAEGLHELAPDLVAFQEAVVDVLTTKLVAAADEAGAPTLVLGGGVAANSRLRLLAEERAAKLGISVRVPRPRLCTDNGAMVAALGSSIVERGRPPSSYDLPADSSLPVTSVLAG